MMEKFCSFDKSITRDIFYGYKKQFRKLAKAKNYKVDFIPETYNDSVKGNLGNFFYFEKTRIRKKWKETLNFYESKNLSDLSEMMKKLKDFPFDIGDTIFVKEKFLTCNCKECEICTRENGIIYELDFDEEGKHKRLYSCTLDELGDDAFDMACTMTRKEARIFLEITDIKIERIQDISYEDLIKETGFRSFNKEDKIFIENQYEEYAKEWDRKHKKGSKWKDNPIVFVYSFKKGKK